MVSITKPGAEIHGYQPTPGDLVRAQGADLILWNGLNLEVWFEQFLGNLSDVPAAVISAGVEPISISGGEYDGKPNPHGWMALSSALIYVDNIRDAMSAADPANAAIYAANAEAIKRRSPPPSAPCAKQPLPCPKTAAGWSPLKGRFPTSPAISA